MQSITISPQRMLGDIQIDCTIEEAHTDTLTITDHPVEKGANISDHAYRNPAEVVLRIGFSNSSSQAGGDEGYVQQVYEDILTLQQLREPFSVVTGKRSYDNMLIRALGVTTDEKTEAVLSCTVTCREVIMVQTQVTSTAPSSAQADPQKTGSVQNGGTKQLQPATLSPAH